MKKYYSEILISVLMITCTAFLYVSIPAQINNGDDLGATQALVNTMTGSTSMAVLNAWQTDLAAIIATSSMTGLTSASNLATIGTITSGTWQGTAIADAYVANDITASNYLALTAWYATTTDILDEGSTNLYYTPGRVYAILSATTSLPNLNIAESQISDLQNYLLSADIDTIAELSALMPGENVASTTANLSVFTNDAGFINASVSSQISTSTFNALYGWKYYENEGLFLTPTSTQPGLWLGGADNNNVQLIASSTDGMAVINLLGAELQISSIYGNLMFSVGDGYEIQFSGMTLFPDGSVSGIGITNGSNAAFFDSDNISTTRTFAFPDFDGTFAVIDASNKLTLSYASSTGLTADYIWATNISMTNGTSTNAFAANQFCLNGDCIAAWPSSSADGTFSTTSAAYWADNQSTLSKRAGDLFTGSTTVASTLQVVGTTTSDIIKGSDSNSMCVCFNDTSTTTPNIILKNCPCLN